MLPLKPPISIQPVEPFNRLFAVELLLPESDREENALPEERAAASALPDPEPTPNASHREAQQAAPAKQVRAREATVSLDRLDDADVHYRSYLGHLRSRISSEWHYPPEASNRGLTGTVTVRFAIDRSGRLASVGVTNSSSHRILDAEALRTIRAAAPFQAFPQDFTINKLNVLASFEYEFNGL